MIEIVSLLCILGAIILLIILSVIDLKHWILPDELNLAFGITGVVFHLLNAYTLISLRDMIAGAAAGAGLLYTIRYVSNRHYGKDTLGLGDVKLLGAAGLWLGLNGTLEAITVGAFAGLIHGFGYAFYIWRKNKTPFTVSQLAIPAGPGFAVGIVFSGFHLLSPYIRETFDALFS